MPRRRSSGRSRTGTSSASASSRCSSGSPRRVRTQCRMQSLADARPPLPERALPRGRPARVRGARRAQDVRRRPARHLRRAHDGGARALRGRAPDAPRACSPRSWARSAAAPSSAAGRTSTPAGWGSEFGGCARGRDVPGARNVEGRELHPGILTLIRPGHTNVERTPARLQRPTRSPTQPQFEPRRDALGDRIRTARTRIRTRPGPARGSTGRIDGVPSMAR